MSGASDILDPVEAARDEISKSKHLIASTLDDLTRHHSWLESYHRDERRRAQRLRRQEALQALELRRQRAAWRLRRFALKSLALTRATAVFLARNSAAFLAWAAPRAQALALLLARDASAALSWSRGIGRSLAHKGFEHVSTGFAWSVRTSDALGIAFRTRLSAGSARLYAQAAIRARPIVQPALKRASVSWTRTRFRSKRLASTLQAQLQDGWTQTRLKAPALARNAVTATSQDCVRLAERALVITASGRDRLSVAFERARAHSQHAARAGFTAASETWSRVALHARRALERRAAPNTNQHRALIVRQCTALVCFEPRRARLPVVRPAKDYRSA